MVSRTPAQAGAEKMLAETCHRVSVAIYQRAE